MSYGDSAPLDGLLAYGWSQWNFLPSSARLVPRTMHRRAEVPSKGLTIRTVPDVGFPGADCLPKSRRKKDRLPQILRPEWSGPFSTPSSADIMRTTFIPDVLVC